MGSVKELEDRLTQVRYELEACTSKIRLYNNQINYSTITLTIQEAEHISPTIEKKICGRK